MREGNFPDDRAAGTRTTLQVPSLVDALYAEIRERILTGAVPAGSPVTEMDLATQYSVARPTAKASMERLVQEGLLRRGSHKTARVPILGVGDLQDLYHTRGFLEREVVMELATKGVVPEQARKSLDQLRDIESTASVIEVVNLDMGFHSELVGAIRSPRLDRLYRWLAGEVRLCMAQLQANHLLSASRIASEHGAILDCIAHEDVDGAVATTTAHIEQACARLIAHVEKVAAAGGGGEPGSLGAQPVACRDSRALSSGRPSKSLSSSKETCKPGSSVTASEARAVSMAPIASCIPCTAAVVSRRG